MFNASRERVGQVSIWVRLPGLSLPFWFEDHFTYIGNLLSTFLEADTSYKLTKVKRVARILVNINIRNGLPGVVRLALRQCSYCQVLDYEHVSFMCRCCHDYGHLYRDCPHNPPPYDTKPSIEEGTQGFFRVQEKKKGAR